MSRDRQQRDPFGSVFETWEIAAAAERNKHRPPSRIMQPGPCALCGEINPPSSCPNAATSKKCKARLPKHPPRRVSDG